MMRPVFVDPKLEVDQNEKMRSLIMRCLFLKQLFSETKTFIIF